MRILMVGPFPGQISGMTIANQMLYDGLIEEGYHVEYVNTDTNKSFSSFNTQGKFNLYKIVTAFNPIFEGVKKIKSRKFDVVYITPAQSYLGFMKYTYFIKAAKKLGIPCYIHIHGSAIRKMYDELDNNKKVNIKKYIQMCDGAIVLGESLRYLFKDILSEDKILVCENGVQDEFILSKEEVNDKVIKFKKDKKIRILYLSNLMKTKGIIQLLDAAIQMKNNNVDFHLDLAGVIEPEIQQDIEDKMQELGEKVTYHGLVKGNEKKNLLINNYIFCLPTYYPNEGQPISILEAMTTANSVVTTNFGGIKDIFIDKTNGHECSCEPKSISEAIMNSYDNYEKIATGNYGYSIEKYTKKQFTLRIVEILKNKLSEA